MIELAGLLTSPPAGAIHDVSTIAAMSEPSPRGFTIWLTGLSGAGKTTVGVLVSAELERRGMLVDRLDGDAVRQHLSAGLGFSKTDRDANIARISWVASRLTRAGAAVVVSAISPFAAARKAARELVEPYGAFVEVYVAASVDVCARRDVKGLYERALRGELADFTGVTAPYEEPEQPEVRLDTEHETPAESAAVVLDYLERAGLLSLHRADEASRGSVATGRGGHDPAEQTRVRDNPSRQT